MNRPIVPFVLLLALSACASPAGSGPSLLPRAAEKQSFDEPAATPDPLATPDPALTTKIAGIVADRIDASTAFAEADKRFASQLAAGAKAKVGSDAWLDAQTALTELDAARGTMADALTELEQLAIARAAAGEPPYPALETARTETEAEVARVTTIVNARKQALPL